MKLFNSLSGRKETFEPAIPGRPSMYVCGPTVYNHPHIGNARPAVVFDVLHRLLAHRYGDVLYARNVTDIDDKIIAQAAREGTTTEAIAARYEAAYEADMEALGVRPPTVRPHATEFVPPMIDLIQRLIVSGHAYEVEGHVLFHVPGFAAYGALSRRSREEMIDGARVEVAPYKRDPADFVLWKPSAPDQPGWDSPFGRGRPGWHTECSAMIEAVIGETVDIHGGGQDLKFPHHENEIAQSACAHHGAPLARFWLHNGFVNVEQEKMSKSVGNVLLVKDLLSEAPGEAIRYALLATHYRKPLDWSTASFAQARHALDRLYRTLAGLDGGGASDPLPAPPAAVVEALEDDLNTPKAFAALFELARQANAAEDTEAQAARLAELRAAGRLLGLLQHDPETWLRGAGAAEVDADAIERLLAARAEARQARRFEEADAIRDQLAAQGIVIEDAPDRTRWRLAS